MFAPVIYPESLEPLVRTIEDTPDEGIVAVACDHLRAGTPAGELMLASALAVIRSADMPPVHHGGPVHPVAALHAVRHMAARLPGKWALLPVIQNVVVANRHIHQPRCAPYILPATEPLAVEDSVAATLAAIEHVARFGEYNACDRHFLYLLDVLPPVQVLDHLLQIAMPKNPCDDHYLLYPVLAWRVARHFGWQPARVLLRSAVRFVTRPPGPPALERVEALIAEHGVFSREPRVTTGEDESDAIAALSDGIGRTCDLNEVTHMLARAVAAGLSLEGTAEGLSVGASRLFLRSRTRDWMEVHANTTANVQRWLMRQPDLGVRTKVRALLVWDSGPDVRLLRRQLAPAVLPDPTRVRSLAFRSQESSLAEIEELITSCDARGPRPTPERPRSTDDVIDEVAALVCQYGDLGYDPAALVAILARIVCRNQSTEMHAYKHHQAACEEFYTTRPSLRWTHLVAAAQGAALAHHQEDDLFREAAARLQL